MFKVGDLIQVVEELSVNIGSDVYPLFGNKLVVRNLKEEMGSNFIMVVGSDLWWWDGRFELVKSAIINQILKEI